MPHQLCSFPLIKVSATGNDFLVVDLTDASRQKLWQQEWSGQSRAELTRQWCDRHYGLGADGLVVLEPQGGVDFAWDFYNSDGGSAEMCGNAARAVSLYFSERSGRADLRFQTRAGLVQAHVESAEKIDVELPAIAEFEWNQTSQAGPFDFVRAGVPHAVLVTTQIQNQAQLREIALKVKTEARFRAAGVNVTFVQKLAPERVKSVTFERGVEDFTLACGTGAIAAAFTEVRGREGKPVEVQVPGGRLSVIWKAGRPILTGPAQLVAEMRVFLREAR